jgi:hypothetical protein
MSSKESQPVNSKISLEFAGRLRRLGPEQQTRVVLFLTLPTAAGGGRRQDTNTRQKSVETVKNTATEAVKDVDRILKEYGGTRRDAGPNALGALAIETTAEGISALASCDWVKSIVEDQSIRGLQQFKTLAALVADENDSAN